MLRIPDNTSNYPLVPNSQVSVPTADRANLGRQVAQGASLPNGPALADVGGAVARPVDNGMGALGRAIGGIGERFQSLQIAEEDSRIAKAELQFYERESELRNNVNTQVAEEGLTVDQRRDRYNNGVLDILNTLSGEIDVQSPQGRAKLDDFSRRATLRSRASYDQEVIEPARVASIQASVQETMNSSIRQARNGAINPEKLVHLMDVAELAINTPSNIAVIGPAKAANLTATVKASIVQSAVQNDVDIVRELDTPEMRIQMARNTDWLANRLAIVDGLPVNEDVKEQYRDIYKETWAKLRKAAEQDFDQITKEQLTALKFDAGLQKNKLTEAIYEGNVGSDTQVEAYWDKWAQARLTEGHNPVEVQKLMLDNAQDARVQLARRRRQDKQHQATIDELVRNREAGLEPYGSQIDAAWREMEKAAKKSGQTITGEQAVEWMKQNNAVPKKAREHVFQYLNATDPNQVVAAAQIVDRLPAHLQNELFQGDNAGVLRATYERLKGGRYPIEDVIRLRDAPRFNSESAVKEVTTQINQLDRSRNLQASQFDADITDILDVKKVPAQAKADIKDQTIQLMARGFEYKEALQGAITDVANRGWGKSPLSGKFIQRPVSLAGSNEEWLRKDVEHTLAEVVPNIDMDEVTDLDVNFFMEDRKGNPIYYINYKLEGRAMPPIKYFYTAEADTALQAHLQAERDKQDAIGRKKNEAVAREKAIRRADISVGAAIRGEAPQFKPPVPPNRQ